MAPNPKKERPGRGVPEVFKEISARNVSGLGWSADDFGITRYEENVKGTAPAGGTTMYFQPSQAGKNATTVLGGTPQTPAWGTLPKNNVLSVNTPASQVLTPAQQAQVAQFMEDPQAAAMATGPIEGTKTFLSNLFNYEDSYGANYKPGEAGQAPDNPVEAVWDGMLKGLGWGYDTLNHLTTAALSAMPGGTRTLTWDESQDVSVGQQIVANAGVSAGRIRRGEGSVWDVVGNGGIPLIGGLIAGAVDPDTAIQQEGWDITKEQDRKVFEQGYEKFFSGAGDLAFTLFADPLIIGGKVAKVARIKWVDRVVDTEEARVILRQELAAGAPGARETAGKMMSPRAMFVDWATKTDETGRKAVTREEIFYHPVVQRAAKRDQLAAALYNAQDYETGALLLRYAYGDATAKSELFAKRADLLDAMGRSEWERLNLIYHLNPDRKAVVESIAQKAADKANDRVFTLEKAGKRGSEEWKLAVRARDNANDMFVRIGRGKFDPITDATPEAIALAKQVYRARVHNDQVLAKAIGDEYQRVGAGINGAMNQSTKGFAVNNRWGRRIEARRQKNATAKYETQAARGRQYETGKVIVRKDENGKVISTAKEMRTARPWKKSYWEMDEFGNNGFTRTVRLWRWMSEENPSGFIITKGQGAQESSREVIAVMDDVNIYSGAARKIMVPKMVKDKATGKMKETMVEVEVGGVKRKQELIGMYMDALNDTTAGADNAQVALERLENAMFNDITAWHGISKEAANQIKTKADEVRRTNMESLRDPERRFWTDPDDGSINKLPWLESQIQNGTYMLNYRALEKQARIFDETGMARFADEFGTFTGKTFMPVYTVFNDFWRPAVLMRLGYTQRNVLEGWFRAAAMQSSLKPIAYGIANGSYSAKNALVNFRQAGVAKQAAVAARLREAGNGSIKMPKKYTKWLEKQIMAREDSIADTIAYMDESGLKLAGLDPEYRDFMLDYFRKRQNYALDRQVAARNAGADADEVASWQEMIDDAFQKQQSLTKIKTFAGKSEDSEIAFSILKYNDQLFDDNIARRLTLDNEAQSVALYQQQGRARQRIASGSNTGPDGLVMREAFDADSNFTPVALSMLSSDTTTKSMLELRMEGQLRTLKAVTTKPFQTLNPGDPNYWDGLASMLAQIDNSALGKRIIKGQSDEEIFDFLYKSNEGREIMDFIAAGKSFGPDDVITAIQTARTRYNQLVPTPEAQDFMRGAVIDENWTGRSLETLLGAKDANGQFIHKLNPVVGNVQETFGFKNAMDIWRSFTSTGMKYLGTLPEDTLVRQPFYATRHAAVLKELRAQAEAQVGPITQRELDGLNRMAHARALKDTKDYLYTIDRRTNLGTYGEMVLPFISAAQNSITTVGRIAWNDPAVPAIMARLWNAPNQAGLEDEDGNIIIPMPHEIIPDGIEEALGLNTMMNWKFKKSQLNFIVPETGFGFAPRPGPLVGVPANEIMKRGWFGMSVESPEFLRNLLGSKEAGDQAWNVWKAYIFGEGQGITPDSLSLLAPPVAQKFIQMIQGEGNAQFAYWYNLQYRTEWANWMAGYRDDIPTKDEIMARTRGFYTVRMAANLVAITPPQYESMIDPLVEISRKYDQLYPEDSARRFNQQFGPFLQMIGDYSNSRNVAGMAPTADAVETARKYSDLIGAVSPDLERMGDLSALSMLTMGGTANSLYDDSAYGWQFANDIPGINETFRKYQKPEQAWTQSRINAGWTTYLTAMDQFDARLAQAGFSNYRQYPELQAEKNEFISQMADNPMFQEWWQDYKEYGSSRTLSAVTVMEAALAHPQFSEDMRESPIWQNASQYLIHRQAVLDELNARGGTINSADNEDIRQYWDDARAFLSQNKEWAAFQNRFLNGDDNPEEPGVQMLDYVVTPEGEAA